MCFIPRNYHRNAAVYNATVRMKDGSFRKWSLNRLDAAHLLSLWKHRIFSDSRFCGVLISDILKVSLKSRFDSSDDFVLS